MKKTLLLCFIHGFKGGEDTFGDKYQFTEDLRMLISKELPKIDVKVIIYPRYETRGDLFECVGRFRDWLLEKVIDLEVAAGTPSPTIDPSVRTILIGHSMGGIVAAETVIALTSDKPISTEPTAGDATADDKKPPPSPSLSGLMFPYVQGVLAFDTPFLGIAPGVVAHGAEGHYSAASAAMTQLSGLTGAFWGGGAAAAASAATTADKKPMAALPAPEKKKEPAAAAGAWGSWGKIAMYAGAGAALAAGGAAAYMNKDHLTEGWSWATSHLEFVGCLAKGEELRRRVGYMVRANKELDVGFGNLYTRLGKAASSKQVTLVGTMLPSQRTFCNLPRKEEGGDWREAVNDASTDETGAHMAMFEPKLNPNYTRLTNEAKQMIVSWTNKDWYEGSSAGNIEEP